MRAREVAAPSAADLDAAERELSIVRRYYVPPAPLATVKKSPDDTRAGPGSTEQRTGERDGRPSESRKANRKPRRGTSG